MKIKCQKCGLIEEVNISLIIKIIGGAMPIGGFWAWVTYFFAGTGFALPICIALVTGGTAMLVFKDEIVSWIIQKGYSCNNCHQSEWKVID
ncbi:hypothetical protein [Avibacterium paragallinarum]|nr:hypothetical protein [Avibacterium paragallinarum]KKB02512.1 hypothetical protein Z012_00490 [Avibacterium paragallinarum]TID27208.1 hypothetical protein JO83_04310 [Avibacterium paragallinarum]